MHAWRGYELWSVRYAGLCLIDERLAADGRSLWFGGSTTDGEEEEQSDIGDEGILRTICTCSDWLACPKA